MIDYAYYNGVFSPYDSATIPLSDRAIFFGDAVYDVVLGIDGSAYQLDVHLDRLYENARRIGLTSTPERSAVEEAIDTLLYEAMADNFLLYVQFSSSERRRTHIRSENSANLLITVTECIVPYEVEFIKAITLPDNRHNFCDIKTICLLPSVLSIEEANRRLADIAIFHKNGSVTECSHANVCILKNGEIIAHPFDSSILPGITQCNLLKACQKAGIPYSLREFSVSELFDADAVMVTSTTKLIKICTEIDGVPLNTSGARVVRVLFDLLRKDIFDKSGRKVN